jgi:putative ABC transport system permease protein
MFTVAQGVLLRPLSALRRSHGVVTGSSEMLPADARALAAQRQIFERAATMRATYVFPSSERTATPVYVAAISPGFFRLFNVQPQLGRAFRREEYQPGHDAEVILAYSYWRKRFGGDPAAALGRSIQLAGRQYRTIVGVMPAWFRFRDPAFGASAQIGAWVPLALSKAQLAERGPPRFLPDGELAPGSDAYLQMVAELKPGIALAEANRRLHAVALSLALENRQDVYLRTFELIRPKTWLVQWTQRSLWLLLAASALALLVSVTNYIALVTATWAGRSREMFLREALGASPFRMLRLATSENAVEALCGASIAVGVAFAGIRVFEALAPPPGVWQIPRLAELSLGWTAVASALLASFAAAMIAAALAISTARRSSPAAGLRQGSSGTVSGGGRKALRACGTLTILQLASATVLLVAVGLVAKSLWRVGAAPLGFGAANVQFASVGPRGGAWVRIGGPKALKDLREAIAGLQSEPGVESACLATDLFPWPGEVEFAPQPPNRGSHVGTAYAWWQKVTGSYFATMGIPLLAGHPFSRERADRKHEVLVSQALVQEYFHEANPVGAEIQLYLPGPGETPTPSPSAYTIAGVVENVSAAGPEQPIRPEIYTALSAAPSVGAYILVRSDLSPQALSNDLRVSLAQIDGRMVSGRFEPFLTQRMRQVTAPARFFAVLSAVFALAAIAIAVLGLYALSWLNLRLRAREIAIRRALGGQRGQILVTVLRRVALTATAGVLLGALAAGGLVRLARYWFFGVSPADPWTYAAVVVFLAAASLAAQIIAAWRALRVNEGLGLRTE